MISMIEDGTKKDRRGVRGIVIMLVSLVVVGLALLGVILKINLSGGIPDAVEIENSNRAINDAYNILNRYRNESGYNVGDAVDDYERLLDECNTDVCKVRVAVIYADFVYGRYENLERAVGILDRYSDIIEDVDSYAKMDYYIEYSGLYAMAGDTGAAQYYSDLIDEMFGEDIGETDD